jgi:hypothetical protein
MAAVADRMVAADIAAGSSESGGARKQEAAEHNSSAAFALLHTQIRQLCVVLASRSCPGRNSLRG